jgi:mxaL protein
MRKLIAFFSRRRDAKLLGIALVLLIAASLKPTVPFPRNIYSYIFVADISQSMNVVDATIDGKPVSRMAFTQYTLHHIISGLPCGTHVSIGLFAGVSIAALYTPIEVCSNYASIQETIDHLDWRTAWSGNSRLRDSMLSLARVLRAFPEPAQVVYFTDGEEAPKLHAFNTKDLSNFQGGNGWLFVGVGSTKGTPIPKLDEKNQLIGYWANDSFAMQPGIAQISEANLGVRNNDVANSTGDRFLSRLQEDYLKSLAKEVNADYVRGDNLAHIQTAMKNQRPARHAIAPYDIDWILALIAMLFILFAYLPKNLLKSRWIFFKPFQSK